jgi:nucleotide-binding universal stress UspA family protein
MKILIAYDGSEYADAAIEDLSRAGLPDDTEAIILTVTETWLPSSEDSYITVESDEKMWYWRKKALEKVAEFEKAAQNAVARVRQEFSSWQARYEITCGYPEWAVVKEADKFKADLIVIGSQGRGSVGRLALGSVSLKVLSEAHCSVRVARQSPHRKEGDNSPLRIVVGIDGSPDSKLAVEAIAERRWQPESQIRLVTAVEPVFQPGVYENYSSLEKDIQDAEEIQQPAVERLKSAGLQISSVVRPGRAKNVLLKEAEEWNADSIFIGAKGHRFLERILLGSVSYSIAARADCSVEVVRGE